MFTWMMESLEDDVMTEALEQGVLKFPRSTRPACASGSPCLIGFGDGAEL